jgi:multidrug efflux pump subunit AcrA (membrane-fusion protein)
MRYDETQTKSESGGVTKHLWRIAALLILIVAGVLLFQYRDTLSIHISQVLASGEDDPIPVAKLSKQAFSVTVPSTGEVVGLKTTSITTPETTSRGSMKLAWLIPEGSFVQAGDAVVRFDNTDAQLNLEQRQNTLEENQQQTKITTLDQATNEKVLAIDRTDAEMDYEYAMTVMPEDETIFSKWDIITAQADANYAKERIDFLKSKGKTQKRIARSDQQILAIERNKAQAEIAVIQDTLNSLEVRSPAAGLVIYTRDHHNEDPQIGDECHPGESIIELVNLDVLQARIYVLERDGGNLEKGLPVEIKLDAIPEKIFHGTIRTVSSVAGSLELDSPLRYFTCDVDILDAGQDLKRIRPGMNLRGDVVLEQYDSCFVIPSSAVTYREKEGDCLVYLKQGEDFVQREVQTGLGTQGEAIILDGVQDGDLIALRNPYQTRQLYLPDFSKGGTDTRNGMPGGMMMRGMMGGGGGRGRR